MKRLLFLLLIIACGAPAVTDNTAVFNEMDLRQGVGSLDIELIKDADEIYVYDTVTDTMEIRNNLAYNIENLKVSIYGMDQRYWSMDPLTEAMGNVEGRLEENGGIGARELTSFELININLPNMYNSKSYEYGYSLDFQSSTDFIDEDVCVGSVQYFTNEASTMTEACTVDTSLSYAGQGSLLNVKTIDILTKAHTAGELWVSGTLKNGGNGDVLLVSNIQGKVGTEELTCYFKDNNRDASTIWTPDTHGELTFDCDPILFNSQPFYTSLRIEFDYDYRQYEDSRIKVIR